MNPRLCISNPNPWLLLKGCQFGRAATNQRPTRFGAQIFMKPIKILLMFACSTPRPDHSSTSHGLADWHFIVNRTRATFASQFPYSSQEEWTESLLHSHVCRQATAHIVSSFAFLLTRSSLQLPADWSQPVVHFSPTSDPKPVSPDGATVTPSGGFAQQLCLHLETTISECGSQ